MIEANVMLRRVNSRFPVQQYFTGSAGLAAAFHLVLSISRANSILTVAPGTRGR
jgi:hypothetical protein